DCAPELLCGAEFNGGDDGATESRVRGRVCAARAEGRRPGVPEQARRSAARAGGSVESAGHASRFLRLLRLALVRARTLATGPPAQTFPGSAGRRRRACALVGASYGRKSAERGSLLGVKGESLLR